jgi:hypothetical protein
MNEVLEAACRRLAGYVESDLIPEVPSIDKKAKKPMSVSLERVGRGYVERVYDAYGICTQEVLIPPRYVCAEMVVGKQ